MSPNQEFFGVLLVLALVVVPAMLALGYLIS